ncbi:MAG: hypothetical protein WBC62_07020 [Candidatus Macondimonas sp.]
MDIVGAIGGPLLALVLMGLSAGSIRAVFAVAAVPALLPVLLVAT